MIDPIEIEHYESKTDYIALALMFVGIGLLIVAILWEPDVEAIGTFISNLIN